MGGLAHQGRTGYLDPQEIQGPKATEDRREKEVNLELGCRGVRVFLDLQQWVCRAHQVPRGLKDPRDPVEDVIQKIASILHLLPTSRQAGSEKDGGRHRV